MIRRVSLDERRTRLALRHRLLRSTRTDDLPTIADDLVALHSSDPVSVYLSSLVRMAVPSLEAVDRALYDERTLVRHHAMRRTLWVATPATARLMHAAATRKLAGAEHRRTVKFLQESGIEDGDAWLAKAGRDVMQILAAHGPMTARRLGQLVPALAYPLRRAAGMPDAATQAAHTRVLLGLGLDGELVRTRPTGTWVNGQYTWAVMRSWLPEGVDGLDERYAAQRLAHSWLRRFGPATLPDLQWWTGWTVGTTRTALTDCGAEQVELDGQVGWVAAGDGEAPQDPGEPWEALLPGLDPTTMGWKQRDWYLPAEAADCFDRNGNAGPTIWVDGQVVGAWAQAKDGQIRTHWFVPVPSARRERVLQRAEELRSWLGSTRFSVRFPGRVNASLLAAADRAQRA